VNHAGKKEPAMTDDRLVAFAQALVQCPSLPGDEKQVTGLVIEEMRSLGYDEVWVDLNGSAVGIIRGAAHGPTLLFDAHTDTVGIAPGLSWRHDPFSAQIEAGAIYGRGIVDMKGALAAMVHAAAATDRSLIAGRVVVSASVLEEVLEGAALRAVMDAAHPDFVVIGEPSDLRLVHGGRGRAEIHLETVGRPAHSSSPQLGRNAVLDMLQVIEAMEQMPMPSHPLLGPAVQVLTGIISDPYPPISTVPSRCHATYDRRLLVGESAEEILGRISADPSLATIELHATIAGGEYRTYTGALLSGPKFLPAWLLPREDPFVRAAMRGLASAGLAPGFDTYRFCTNAAYSAGTAGVPTVGFGPGSEAQAHVVDEHMEIPDLLAARDGYRGIIESVLG
jgi:putative selenium metabolism hydrolase